MSSTKGSIVIALLIVSITGLAPFAAAETATGYTITATANVNGSITPSGPVPVAAGGSQTLTITPHPGYHIQSVIVDGSNKGSVKSYTFTNVKAGHTIVAFFKPITHTITATTEANGTISSPGVNTVTPGSSMTFTFTPSAGYHVAAVLIDGVRKGAEPSYTFRNVKASHTITAAFAENAWYIIEASARANGAISPSGRGAVLGGTNQKYTMSPAPGYRVADVVVDDVRRGALSSYTFYNVQEPHTISARFVPDVYTITVIAETGGVVEVAGAAITPNLPAIVKGGEYITITADPAANLSLTITPIAGRSVRSLVDSGTYKYGITTYSLTNIRKDHTINVYFK
jgi:hypothetical protein